MLNAPRAFPSSTLLPSFFNDYRINRGVVCLPLQFRLLRAAARQSSIGAEPSLAYAPGAPNCLAVPLSGKFRSSPTSFSTEISIRRIKLTIINNKTNIYRCASPPHKPIGDFFFLINNFPLALSSFLFLCLRLLLGVFPGGLHFRGWATRRDGVF